MARGKGGAGGESVGGWGVVRTERGGSSALAHVQMRNKVMRF